MSSVIIPERYLAENRECGRCTACCTALAVEELGKVAGTRCASLRSGRPGCKVHLVGKPASCVRYECSWKAGAFGDSMRPDTSGAVIDGHQTPMGPLPMIHLLSGFDSERTIALFSPAMAHGVYCVVYADGKRHELRFPDGADEATVQDWTDAIRAITVLEEMP